MENKVYYGEYSLKHWIDLILKGNILLPWYQRSFVWEKKQIEDLIKTLDDNQFVPPVIIGAVKEGNEWKNYILDGQQRLTSILFARYNRYIDKNEYTSKKASAEILQSADEVENNEDESNDDKIKMIRWRYDDIIENHKINFNELQKDYYKDLFPDGTKKNETFFTQHYLGFAYIKPGNNVNDEEQSKFYSDVFRNINTGGSKLTRLESRKSLYFLKESLKDFFAPAFLDNIKVETSSKESGLIDFIKYLSILSQYKGNNDSLLKYGSKSDWQKTEDYYKKYITAVVDNDSDNELKFDISYPASPYSNERMDKLKKSISELDIPESFSSIINMDMYYFGLVNEVIFQNNNLDETKKDALKTELDAKIQELKEQENHRDNPNALKYLKPRISASIDIYKKYRKATPNE